MEKFDTKVTQNALGFWEVDQKPSAEQIQNYYSSDYYQNAKGSYDHSYSDNELAYFENKLEQRWSVISKRFSTPGSLLDVGCGEGYALSFFSRMGWSVRGLDFSRAGLESKNPHCVKYLVEGDVFALLAEEQKAGAVYEVIWLQNVLEHVVDPVGLMKFLRTLVKPGGVLVVTVPNDFSRLQIQAKNKGIIDRDYWIALPDHLSYFSHESLYNIGLATRWEVLDVLGDFPVDWFLFHSHANYIANPSLGKAAHNAKISLENIIADSNIEDVTAFYSSLARIGMGRNLTAFYVP